MKLIYSWFVLIILSINFVSIRGKTFFVSDYNAYPNDDLDDTHGIQLAINEAIKYGLVSDIIFGYGVYTISSTIAISNAINLTITGQGMDETFLIGSYQITIFTAYSCQGLKLTSFSIDYNPLPFTAGYIVDVNDKYLDLQVVPPHQTDIDRKIGTILRYDPIQKRPAFGSNTYEIYQTPPADANTTIVSPGVLRLPLTSPTGFRKGDPIVARYTFGYHAIYGQDLVDITIESITIYTSWLMGVATIRSRRLKIHNYHVLPHPGRWMSTAADCMHFLDTRESISISDSECQAMGDDGLNVHAMFFQVTQVIDSTTVIIEESNWDEPLNFGIGTNLEFSANQQPFSVHGSGTVASIVFNSTYSRKITFTNSVNASVGDWACVSDTPVLTIRNFTVANNRARGVLLETRNIDIRQSVFYRTSGPAVLIQPSMYWREGPEARNVSLIENLYIENNEGIAQEKGIITILPDPIHLVPVINDIRIESSTFVLGNSSQGLLQSNNMNNLFLSGNYIATNNSTPIISICNSRNISAENNCVVNNQTKITEYYTFDQGSPCSMNLSSLINLPPSAFNSSFSPPVIPKQVFNQHHYFISKKSLKTWFSLVKMISDP
ncbi:unnamed protein product [Adineta steineri]|uniref:Pectate lyase superfamily protein domain-containing protein n=1 Tax=Adineta steineri TaxID=433720 RepID=A0A819U121_9BILA|nr:unnamed protein product [Adineta steineri]